LSRLACPYVGRLFLFLFSDKADFAGVKAMVLIVEMSVDNQLGKKGFGCKIETLCSGFLCRVCH
jgi:hypothetical protein